MSSASPGDERGGLSIGESCAGLWAISTERHDLPGVARRGSAYREPRSAEREGLLCARAIRGFRAQLGDLIPLVEGENTLGRDEGATVRIDVPGISRRHARIHIHHGRAAPVDLVSKNGTFLQDGRVVGFTTLADGAVFRLGRMTLVYRSGPESGSTLTEATSANDLATGRGAR